MPKILKRAGGIFLKDKKVLVCKANDHDIFLPPGGAVEEGETMEEALKREILEELSLVIEIEDLELFNIYKKPSDDQEPFDLEFNVYTVKKWTGDIKPDNEIEQFLWIDSKQSQDIKLGSIFESQVLPKLKKLQLIA